MKFLFFVVLSFLGSTTAVSLLLGSTYWDEIVLGWAIAIVFNLVGLIIKIRSIGKDIRHFFFYLLILNTVNLAGFFVLAIFVPRKTGLAAQPFILSLFVAYFILVVYDIYKLRFTALRHQAQTE